MMEAERTFETLVTTRRCCSKDSLCRLHRPDLEPQILVYTRREESQRNTIDTVEQVELRVWLVVNHVDDVVKSSCSLPSK